MSPRANSKHTHAQDDTEEIEEKRIRARTLNLCGTKQYNHILEKIRYQKKNESE